MFQNSSSWVLYNMASFYWRMKNEPQKAVDCVVRALHFSPRYCEARQTGFAVIFSLLHESGHRCICVFVVPVGSTRI